MKKAVQILIFLVFVCRSGFSQLNLQDGLKAYYPFNSNTNDESGNGNHGINNGATPTYDRFGNENSAYLFNGSSSYINCGDPADNSFDLTGDFTISCWIQLNLDNQTWNVVASKDEGSGTQNKWIFSYSFDPTELANSFHFVNTAIPYNGTNFSNQWAATLNEWYYLTLLKEGNTFKYYLNSESIGSAEKDRKSVV